MIDESAEMQLKQLLTKALDEAFAQGLESGKRTGFESGRRAGIEEAADIAKTMHDSGEYCFICTAEYEVKNRELLEKK